METPKPMSNTSRSGVPYYLVLILLLIALAGGAAAGILGYIWITGGSGEPSLTVEDALATLEASEDNMAEAVGTAMVDVANTVIAEAVAAAVAEAVDVSVAAAVDSSVAAAVDSRRWRRSRQRTGGIQDCGGGKPRELHAGGRFAWRAHHGDWVHQ